MLFLHGNGGRWTDWAPQLEALGGELRCVAVDQRGFGGSSRLQAPKSYVGMADDAVALLDALGIERATVVGLSMGAIVGQLLGVRSPERLHALLLAGTVRYDEPDDFTATRMGLDRPGAALRGTVANDPERVRAGFQRLFGRAYRRAHPEEVERLSNEMAENDPLSLARPEHGREELTAHPPTGISVPVTLVAGGEDRLAPPHAVQHLAAAIPGCRYVELPGVGHVINVEAAAAFTALVREVASPA